MATAATIMPGVQKPHWKAPSSRKAFWTGWRSPAPDSPSMVTTFLPSAREAGVRQEKTRRPSRSTEQAPHWPSPHPYLVPVSSWSSRRMSSRGRSGSVVTALVWPFTVIFNAASAPALMVISSTPGDRGTVLGMMTGRGASVQRPGGAGLTPGPLVLFVRVLRMRVRDHGDVAYALRRRGFGEVQGPRAG